MPLNRRLAELDAFCRQHPLGEKILICPSHSMGHQLTEALARSGCPWVNLRVETLRSMALGLVADELSAAGLMVVTPGMEVSLVERAVEEIRERLEGPDSYFGPLREMPGFAPSLLAGIQDLRRAGIDGADLQKEGMLVSQRKADELGRLLSAYEEILKQNGLIDQAGILGRALAALGEGKPHPFSSAEILVAAELQLIGLEEKFLIELAGEKLFLLEQDPVNGFELSEQSAAGRLQNRARAIAPSAFEPSPLSHLFALDEAPQIRGGLELSCALSESCEVNQIFRNVIHGDIRADEVDVLYSDADAYVPLFVEASERLGIPCTFSDGLPAAMTQPGRAVLGFLDWMENDFEETILRRLFASGALNLDSLQNEGEGMQAPGGVRAVRYLRAAAIGWGRERSLPCLERLISGTEARLSVIDPDDMGSEKDARDEEKQDRLQRTLAEIRCLRLFLQKLLDLVPDNFMEVEISLLAGVAAVVARDFARRSTERDANAAAALESTMAELASAPGIGLTFSRAAGRLREIVNSIRVMTSGPRPGCIHISHYNTGSHSGRPNLFVIGLDEKRFPGTAIQEPILLDSERARLSARLPLMRDRPTRNIVDLTSHLASHRGSITLSYACRKLLEDREVFPASILLQAHRLATGRPENDFSDLESALADPNGFVGQLNEAVTRSEWWLAQMDQHNGTNLRPILDDAFPWLMTGRAAEANRQSNEFTIYDGRLLSAGDTLDFRESGEPVSPSRLEALARCPYSYFLKHVLGIEPPEELVRDLEVWLDPLQLGSLLHDLFEEFMRELTERSEKPSFERHHLSLRSMAEKKIEAMKEEIPPPSTAAFFRSHRDICRALEIFLHSEQEHCLYSTPRFFEVPFGIRYRKDASQLSLGSNEPIQISINKKKISVRGQIDRVDQVSAHEFAIWDYKTGSTYGYPAHRPFDRGKVLQHALYAAAAEQLLRKQADPESRVTSAGYFFTGTKGEGERVSHERKALAPFQEILSDLLDLLHSGAFVHTPDSAACTFCDYKTVCGGSEEASTQAKMKLGENEILEPYRKLQASKL